MYASLIRLAMKNAIKTIVFARVPVEKVNNIILTPDAKQGTNLPSPSPNCSHLHILLNHNNHPFHVEIGIWYRFIITLYKGSETCLTRPLLFARAASQRFFRMTAPHLT